MPTALVPPPGYREQTRKRVGRSFLTCKIRNLCSLQDTAKKYFKSLGEHICQIHRLKLPNQEHITNSQNSMIRRQRVYVLKGGGQRLLLGGGGRCGGGRAPAARQGSLGRPRSPLAGRMADRKGTEGSAGAADRAAGSPRPPRAGGFGMVWPLLTRRLIRPCDLAARCSPKMNENAVKPG